MARKPPPSPFPEYGSRTRFLEIDRGDWRAIERGDKTEYRVPHPITHIRCPMAVVGWLRAREPQTRLLVVEDAWREPVGAISPESLAREGFPDLGHFRRYWMGRIGKRFPPLDEVQVLRLRPFEPDGDGTTIGLQLLVNLYGPYLPDGFGLSLR